MRTNALHEVCRNIKGKLIGAKRSEIMLVAEETGRNNFYGYSVPYHAYVVAFLFSGD